MTEIPTGDTAGRPPAGGETPSGDERGSAPAPDNQPPAPTSADRADNGSDGDGTTPAAKRRRRGSRGGRNRSRPRPDGASAATTDTDDRNPELPDSPREGQPKSVDTADASLVHRPAAEGA